MPKPPPTITCGAGTFPRLDSSGKIQCIPVSALMGATVTLVQGPDCWPKAFTVRLATSPAMRKIIVTAIKEEIKGIPPAELASRIESQPALLKRVRAARPVRRRR